MNKLLMPKARYDPACLLLKLESQLLWKQNIVIEEREPSQFPQGYVKYFEMDRIQNERRLDRKSSF